MRADVLADGGAGDAIGPAGFRLAHAGERQRAERGETAGGEAGAAQEGAAVETAAGLTGQGALRGCRGVPGVLFS